MPPHQFSTPKVVYLGSAYGPKDPGRPAAGTGKPGQDEKQAAARPR